MLPFPPALQAPAPKAPSQAPTPTYAQAEEALFQALDEDQPLPQALPKGAEGTRYRWLLAAARWKPGAALADPFPAASPAREEAEALRALAAAAPDKADLGKLPLSLTGSRLLLWRWGKAAERRGALPAELRRRWEERLLEPAGPDYLRQLALRHGLCFALAERDRARFSELKARARALSPESFTAFQSLFGFLDTPGPNFRLWTLPGLEYKDLALGRLGGAKVWICPEDPSLPAPPAGLSWIIPSTTVYQADTVSQLEPLVATEAKALAARYGARPGTYYTPARGAWEEQGFTDFPVQLDLDDEGNITAIRMGDAAPSLKASAAAPH